MLTIYLFIFLFGYSTATVKQASVVLTNGDVSGTILFTQDGDSVQVIGTITNLPEGLHGFHIHEKGDITNCTTTGVHFNPDMHEHGDPDDNNHHAGDLGNIEADDKNTAVVNITNSYISLNGANSIIGRALVVHADEDDLGKGNETDSKTTGHAGARLACGVIGLVSEETNSSGETVLKNIIFLWTFMAVLVKLIV